MAEKNASIVKKAQSEGTRAAAKKQVTRGDSYVCEVRGLAVPANETCDSALLCDVDCSGSPGRTRKTPVRAAAGLVRMVGDC